MFFFLLLIAGTFTAFVFSKEKFVKKSVVIESAVRFSLTNKIAQKSFHRIWTEKCNL